MTLGFLSVLGCLGSLFGVVAEAVLEGVLEGILTGVFPSGAIVE